MKNLNYFICLFLLSTILQAQQLKITGTVTGHNDGNPIPGVNVIVKGTTNGITTDFDGYYTIEAEVNDLLVFSYIGFETEQRKINAGDSIIDVVLMEDVAELEEIVVIGYGTTRRSHITASISSVKSESISKRSVRKRRRKSINQNFRGRGSGVQLKKSNTSTNIKIRGISSISGKKQPLYIVDGVLIDKNDNHSIQNMDPSKISSIKVLKDASASAIYGNKAQHGCVVITTHHGNHQLQNNESYKEIQENSFENVQISPLSTFSIDVDKASYSNVRRMINNGETIPADAVKIEEMINYFDYGYAQPRDEHPFAIHTEYGATPWNSETKIVKIGLKGKEIPQNEIPVSNLVFLIDVSGSMDSSNKLPLLKQAFKLLVKQLREKDKVSIVVYAGAAGIVLPPTSGANKNRINQALQNLSAGGSTAGGAGIELAYKIAQKNFIKKGNNRVVLATDGDFNVGMSSDKDMKELIVEKRKSGVFLTCLGFGMGNYKDSKLETLADKGNGNHAYIDSMQEARLVLGKEFGGTLYTIAKDVKIQVEFNPKKIQAYRLIGYENRLLADEDFVDDTKDAGELGNGHTVTALYEVIPIGVKSKFLKSIPELKYTKNTLNKEFGDELLTVKFRYKKPQGKKSIEIVHTLNSKIDVASQDFNFAAAIAWFGMKIRNSKYLEDRKIEHIISLAESNRTNDDQGYKAEFVRLLNSYQAL